MEEISTAKASTAQEGADPKANPVTAGGSVETYVATGLSILALCASVAAFITSRAESVLPAPQVLVYSADHIAGQIGPYVDASMDPVQVIDQAVRKAVAAGNVVIDSSAKVKAPETSMFRLADFVAIGEQISPLAKRELSLPGTSPVPAQQSAPQPPQNNTNELGSDVADFARGLQSAGGFNPSKVDP